MTNPNIYLPAEIRIVLKENGQTTIITGTEVVFKEPIRPRHVKVAADISSRVREILKIISEYRKDNPETFKELNNAEDTFSNGPRD